MAQLTLVKLQDDGSSLLLRSKDGAEFHLPVCANLRAAVASGPLPTRNPDKQSNPPTASQEKVVPQPTPKETVQLRPAEIQARLRAGATVGELAEYSNMDEARIRTFEHAVVSEREFVIATLRDHRVEGCDSAATVGELADARLRARGLEPHEAKWNARREVGSPWEVEVRFPTVEAERSACWHFDLRGRHLTPLDDEARWLSRPDEPITAEVVSVPTKRHVDTQEETAAILEDLAARRGKRGAEQGTAAEKPGRGATNAKTAATPLTPTMKNPMPGKSTAPITAELNELGGAPSNEPKPVTSRAPVVEIGSTNRTGTGNRAARNKRTKNTRTSMPSWDEIMLGPKRED